MRQLLGPTTTVRRLLWPAVCRSAQHMTGVAAAPVGAANVCNSHNVMGWRALQTPKTEDFTANSSEILLKMLLPCATKGVLLKTMWPKLICDRPNSGQTRPDPTACLPRLKITYFGPRVFNLEVFVTRT